jgi:hypothetical protein
MAFQQNLAFDKGETWIIYHTALASDGITPLNLTGASVQIQVTNSGGSVVLAAGVATVSITNATAGQSTITITPAMQSSFTAGQYNYTIRVTLASGVVSDQNYGFITVTVSTFG